MDEVGKVFQIPADERDVRGVESVSGLVLALKDKGWSVSQQEDQYQYGIWGRKDNLEAGASAPLVGKIHGRGVTVYDNDLDLQNFIANYKFEG